MSLGSPPTDLGDLTGGTIVSAGRTFAAFSWNGNNGVVMITMADQSTVTLSQTAGLATFSILNTSGENVGTLSPLG